MTEPTPASAPAGWFPSGVAGEERFWDGADWTDQVRPATSTAPIAPSATPAGWYSDANVPGTERYFDGTAWTEQSRPLGLEPVAPEPGKRPWYKRKGIVIPVGIVGGIIVLSGLINGINGGADSEAVADREPAVSQSDEEPEAAAEPAPEPEDTRVEVPSLAGMTVAEAKAAAEAVGLTLGFPEGTLDVAVVNTQDVSAGENRDPGAVVTVTASVPLTVAQESAMSSANSYMRNIGGFSRQGLIEQLMYEQFSEADATFAVDNGGYDWMASAADSAASYMKNVGGFSRGSLLDQLLYEGFSQAEAEHGVSSVGL